MQSRIALQCVTLGLMKKPKDPQAARRREGMRQFMKDRDLKMKPWADAAGLSDGAIRNFLAGITDSMTGATVRLLARAAGTTEDEIFGEVAAADAVQPEASRTVNVDGATNDLERHIRPVAPLLTGARDLPIYGQARGGDEGDGYSIDPGTRIGMTYRPHALEGVPDAYAIEFWDTSMEPALKHGHQGMVHPKKQAFPGDEVVVQLLDGQAFVKELVRRTEKHLVCKQHNPPKEVRFEMSKVKSVHLIVDTPRVRI